MSSRSVFSIKIDSLSDPVANLCQSIINACKDTKDISVQQQISIFKTIQVKDESLVRTLTSCAKIGSQTPLESLRTLSHVVPIINMTQTEPPEHHSEHKMIYIDRLPAQSWSRVDFKLIIYFVSDLITAYFVEKLAENMINTGKAEIIKFVEAILKDLFATPQETYLTTIKEMNSKYYRRAIGLMSKFISSDIFQFIVSTFTNVNTLGSYYQVVINYFADALITPDSYDSAKSIFDRILQVYKGKTIQNQKSSISNTGLFLYNYLGNIFTQFPQSLSDASIFSIVQDCKTWVGSKQLSVHCFEIMALVNAFMTVPNNQPPLEFGSHHIFSHLSDGKQTDGQILQALTTMLRGNHYSPRTILEQTKQNFGWRLEDPKIVEDVFEYLNSHIDIYVNYQTSLAEFLLQVASSDFDTFVNKFLDRFSDSQFSKNATSAICKAYFVMLDPTSGFQDKAYRVSKELISKVSFKVALLLDEKVAGVAKTNMNISAYEPISFTAELRNRYTIESRNDMFVYRTLGVFNANTKPKQIFPKHRKEIQKWKDELVAGDQIIPKVWPVYDKTTIRIEINPIVTEDTTIIDLLRLAPTITDNFHIASSICKYLCNEDASIGAMATAVLQAAIHFNPTFAPQVFAQIESIYAVPQITSSALFIILKVLTCLLDTLVLEDFKVTKEMTITLMKFVLLGLCADALEIRHAALTCAQNVASADFNLYDLITKKDSYIGQEGCTNALLSLCPDKRSQIRMLDSIPFTTMYAAFDMTFYPFWLACLGQIIAQSKQGFIAPVQAFLDDVINGQSGVVGIQQFAINIVALYYAISIGGTRVENIGKAVQYVFTTFSNGLKNKDTNLCAVFSCVDISIADTILMALNTMLNTVDNSQKLTTLHVTSYFLRMISAKQDFVTKQSSEKLSQPVSEAVYFVINYIFQQRILNRDEVKFEINGLDPSPANYILQCIITDVCICLKRIFDEIAQTNTVESHGPFPLISGVPATFSHSAGSEQTFIFFIGLSSASSKFIFQTAAQEAFASLVAIAPIPDAMFTVVAENLTFIDNEKLKQNILRRYFIDLIARFIDEAAVNYTFFHAIASLFLGDEKFMRKWRQSVSTEFTQQEQDIASQIYLHSGSLLALGFLYLSAELPLQRELAFKFIVSLSTSLFLHENNPKQAVEFLSKLKEFRGRFKTDMSHYIFTDAIKLCRLIAKNLPLIGEQFIAEMVTIDNYITNPPKPKAKEKTKSRGMSVRNKDAIAPQVLVHTDVVTHVSTFTLNSMESRRSLAADFIYPWMTYFKVEPDASSIFSGTEQLMNCYTFSIFIEDILNMKCCMPMSTSVQKIIRAVVDSDHGERSVDLLMCIALRHIFSEDNKQQSANELVRFLFAALPDTVFKHIMSYISFDSWHFYRIQLNKLDLLFDFDQVLAGISNKNDDAVKSTGSLTTEDDSAQDYSFIMPILLEMIYGFILEDMTLIRMYGKQIAAFAFIQFPSFPEACSKLIGLLTPLEVPELSNQSYYSDSGKSIITKVGPWSLDLIGSFFSNLGQAEAQRMYDYILPWAVSYGRTSKTPTALKILDSIGLELPDEDVEGLCRSIMVIAKALYERTTPAIHAENMKKITFFLQLLDNYGKPPYAELYSFLTYAITVLKRARNITPKLFFFVCEFLKCSSSEYMSIFNAAQDFILHALNNKQFVEQISKVESNFPGIANSVFAASLDATGIHKAFDILRCCIEKGLMKLLLGDVNKAKVLVPALLPYASQLSNVVSMKIASFTCDSVLEKCFLRLARSEGDLAEGINSIIAGVIGENEEIASLVLSFYGNVESCGSNDQREIIFYAAASILKHVAGIDQKNQSIGAIARSAVKTTSPTLLRASSALLQAIMERCGGEFAYPSGHGFGNTQFPLIDDILNLRPNDWRQSTSKLAPIYVTHEGFIACSIFGDIRAALEQVMAQPFSMWGELEYKAQAATPQGRNEEKHVKGQNNLNEIMQKISKPSKKSTGNIKSKEVRQIEEQNLINATDFAPTSNDFINLLAELDLGDAPAIF